MQREKQGPRLSRGPDSGLDPEIMTCAEGVDAYPTEPLGN